jgi:hypothetical protein
MIEEMMEHQHNMRAETEQSAIKFFCSLKAFLMMGNVGASPLPL